MTIFKKIYGIIWLLACLMFSCKSPTDMRNQSAAVIFGNPNYQAISYGGFRENTRDVVPTEEQIKEDMLILAALNIKIIRTYNVHLDEIRVLLKVIKAMKQTDPDFEMYVMLGAWIDCKNAWTGLEPNHFEESERNATEIAEAVRLTNLYPDIIKVIAVGNEAMVKWAAEYYVQPGVILKWVNHLQDLKTNKKLPSDLWITSSDNFASWGGGSAEYHVEDLNKLIHAVDFISLHTYPMHDTHYNPVFWGTLPEEENLSKTAVVDAMMDRSLDYAKQQYQSVIDYMKKVGANKPVHIGETGWATQSKGQYGINGSRATDEYKSGLFYQKMRAWTNQKNITCFYFEAFDESWKDAAHPNGSENHFGLINLKSQVKFALWDQFDSLKNLKRDGKQLTKTYQGNLENLLQDVHIPQRILDTVPQP